jgi:hypothetical protein
MWLFRLRGPEDRSAHCHLPGSVTDDDGSYTYSVGRYPDHHGDRRLDQLQQDDAAWAAPTPQAEAADLCQRQPEPSSSARMSTLGGQVRVLSRTSRLLGGGDQQDGTLRWSADHSVQRHQPRTLQQGGRHRRQRPVAVDQANKIADDAPTQMIFRGCERQRLYRPGDGQWVAPDPTVAAPAGSKGVRHR